MILELFSHDDAQVCCTHHVTAAHVPRIGETINSPADANNLNGVSTLMVVDVTMG